MNDSTRPCKGPRHGHGLRRGTAEVVVETSIAAGVMKHGYTKAFANAGTVFQTSAGYQRTDFQVDDLWRLVGPVLQGHPDLAALLPRLVVSPCNLGVFEKTQPRKKNVRSSKTRPHGKSRASKVVHSSFILQTLRVCSPLASSTFLYCHRRNGGHNESVVPYWHNLRNTTEQSRQGTSAPADEPVGHKRGAQE